MDLRLLRRVCVSRLHSFRTIEIQQPASSRSRLASGWAVRIPQAIHDEAKANTMKLLL